MPSVVRAVGDDGSEGTRQLPGWFQQEIDNRAITQGLVGSDAYLEQWRWGDVQERDVRCHRPRVHHRRLGERIGRHRQVLVLGHHVGVRSRSTRQGWQASAGGLQRRVQ